MNLRRFKVAFAAILMVGTVFTACSGEDGEDGEVGATGNANVQSYSYTVANTSWSQGTATISIPALSKSIADNGFVSVFGFVPVCACACSFLFLLLLLLLFLFLLLFLLLKQIELYVLYPNELV